MLWVSSARDLHFMDPKKHPFSAVVHSYGAFLPLKLDDLLPFCHFTRSAKSVYVIRHGAFREAEICLDDIIVEVAILFSFCLWICIFVFLQYLFCKVDFYISYICCFYVCDFYLIIVYCSLVKWVAM